MSRIDEIRARLREYRDEQRGPRDFAKSSESDIAWLLARVAELEVEIERIPELESALYHLRIHDAEAVRWLGAALDEARLHEREADELEAEVERRTEERAQVVEELRTLASRTSGDVAYGLRHAADLVERSKP